MIVVETSGNDGRVRIVQLTEAGLRERAELDHRADDFAQSLLEPLNESQRLKLVAAMAQVERLLIASQVSISLADPTSSDVIWCFEQYFAELGERFEAGFDPDSQHFGACTRTHASQRTGARGVSERGASRLWCVKDFTRTPSERSSACGLHPRYVDLDLGGVFW